MVSEPMPSRFMLDPARADEFIDDLSATENSLHDVASKWKTTTGALSLFLASPEGLAIVAAAEIATAVHVRLQAQALLVDVAQSMVYIVREYSREERRIPFNNDLKSINLVEMRRANARRAGHLLFRLAHYTPAPIRSYTVRPVVEERDQTCGMPKRPLGHGEANDISMPPPSSVAASAKTVAVTRKSSAPTPTPPSITSESSSAVVVHVGAANTSLLESPLNDTPSLEDGSAAPNLVAAPLPISACACHNHLRLCEDGCGSSSLSIHARESTGPVELFTTAPNIPRSRTFHSGP